MKSVYLMLKVMIKLRKNEFVTENVDIEMINVEGNDNHRIVHEIDIIVYY